MHVSIAPHGEVAGSAVGGPSTAETSATTATETTGSAGTDVAAAIDFDRIRAALMVLGIGLHAADVFVSAGDWLVADPHRSVAFDALVALIHSFRVPGFFLLSGLLFAGSLSRHGTPGLALRQLVRLGVPLLTCWAILNAAQTALLAWYRGGDPWEALASISTPMGHLWFVRDLLVINLLVLLWVAIRGALPRRARQKTASTAMPTSHPIHWLTVALIGALLSHVLLVVIRLSGLAYAPGPGGLTLFNLAFYAPMFLAGLTMRHHPTWLAGWLRTPWWLLPVAAFAANWGDAASDTLPNALAREVALAVELLGIWLATGAAIGLLARWRGRGRGGLGGRLSGAWGRALADASYTIFLVHHLMVVALALLLLPLDWPAALKFALIASGALALSLAFHRWVVRPFAVTRLLFNGRLPATRHEPPVTAAAGRA
ncbi:acyltransferase family protein [Roseateles chitinivorans]|uniref:acyltransferase family protein n=1 Tax=Roseateles chitinivorans TaxID=2917965 RepID=UPI003D67DD17